MKVYEPYRVALEGHTEGSQTLKLYRRQGNVTKDGKGEVKCPLQSFMDHIMEQRVLSGQCQYGIYRLDSLPYFNWFKCLKGMKCIPQTTYIFLCLRFRYVLWQLFLIYKWLNLNVLAVKLEIKQMHCKY